MTTEPARWGTSRAVWAAVVVVVFGCADAPRKGRAERDAEPVDGMVPVPAGTVRMGTDEAEIERLMAATGVGRPEPFLQEVPPRAVAVAAFYLDSVEVTNRAFAAFVEANPEWRPGAVDSALHNGRYLAHWTDGAPPDEWLDRPVVYVTWHAGAAYCRWRGKRLPTEAEWEYAAKGGEPAAEYPWGSAPPDPSRVNFAASGHGEAIRVASYAPNPFGLYDLAGNVWEFLADPWYGPYAETPNPVPHLDSDTIAAVRTRRVVRGGSWGANAANLRTRYRDSHRPRDAADIVGFRCARSMDASM